MSNIKQIPKPKFKIPNSYSILREEKPNRFRSLDIGIYDLPARALQWQAGLFVIWCLKFGIL
jgi:hypothetical protein